MTTPRLDSTVRNAKQRIQVTTVTSDHAARPPADMPLPVGTEREQRIAVCAYLRAAERGFTPGQELEDWLAAERELEANGQIEAAKFG